MSDELRKVNLLLRVFAKAIDFIAVASVAEIIPAASFYAGLSYILISDSLLQGRSIGKYFMGLRVISTDTNEPCSVKESIMRNAPFGLGLILYKVPFIGWIFIIIIAAFEFLIILGSKNGARLGDEIAKTLVTEKISQNVQQEA